MTELAELPELFLDSIDWVNQPPPPQARDTHALHFFLADFTGGFVNPPAYQGLLFYREGGHPTSPITGEQNGLDGTGFRVANPASPPLPESWARVHVRFRTQPTARIAVEATLHGADRDRDFLPGSQVRLVAFDEVEFFSGMLTMQLRILGTPFFWQLSFSKTTVLL